MPLLPGEVSRGRITLFSMMSVIRNLLVAGHHIGLVPIRNLFVAYNEYENGVAKGPGIGLISGQRRGWGCAGTPWSLSFYVLPETRGFGPVSLARAEDQPAPAAQSSPAPVPEPSAAPGPKPQPSAQVPSGAPPSRAATTEMAQARAPGDPVVAGIRSKPSDPAIRKDANAADLAALEAFYGRGPDPCGSRRWASRRERNLPCSRSGRPRLGALTPPPSSCRRQTLCRGPGRTGHRRDQARSRHSEICALREGRSPQPARGERPLRSGPLLRAIPRSCLPRSNPPRRQMPISNRCTPSTSSSSACARLCSRRAARARRGLRLLIPPNLPTPPRLPRMPRRLRAPRRLPPRRLPTRNATSAARPQHGALAVDAGKPRAVYVWNNSPEFMLYVMKDGKPIFADKTLVGTLNYATPVFTRRHEDHRLQS